jgi:hypothetical protein
MAFLVVGASCVLMVPIMLYVLRLPGWTWAHACMFGAIVASTDAVAIVAIMRTSEWPPGGGGGGPTASNGPAGGGHARRCWHLARRRVASPMAASRAGILLSPCTRAIASPQAAAPSGCASSWKASRCSMTRQG